MTPKSLECPCQKTKKKAMDLFKKLRRKNKIIRQIEEESPGHKRIFGIYDSKQAGRKMKLRISEQDIESYHKQEWIEKTASGYVLSKVGEAWLRRQLACEDPYKEQHLPSQYKLFEIEKGLKKTLKVNENDTQLQWLRRHKDRNGKPLIGEHQYKAGERLRLDYACAQQTNIITSSWSLSDQVGKHEKRAMAKEGYIALWNEIIAAKENVEKALDAVGPEMSRLIINICCLSKRIEEAEKVEGWPLRSGKVVLQIALTRLARHYGYMSDEQGNVTQNRMILQWGSDNYRPKL